MKKTDHNQSQIDKLRFLSSPTLNIHDTSLDIRSTFPNQPQHNSHQTDIPTSIEIDQNFIEHNDKQYQIMRQKQKTSGQQRNALKLARISSLDNKPFDIQTKIQNDYIQQLDKLLNDNQQLLHDSQSNNSKSSKNTNSNSKQQTMKPNVKFVDKFRNQKVSEFLRELDMQDNICLQIDRQRFYSFENKLQQLQKQETHSKANQLSQDQITFNKPVHNSHQFQKNANKSLSPIVLQKKAIKSNTDTKKQTLFQNQKSQIHKINDRYTNVKQQINFSQDQIQDESINSTGKNSLKNLKIKKVQSYNGILERLKSNENSQKYVKRLVDQPQNRDNNDNDKNTNRDKKKVVELIYQLKQSVKSQAEREVIKGFATNSFEGLLKRENFDRVVIITNIQKPENKNMDVWPNCSFFGLYSGNQGEQCVEYLKEKLYNNIVNNINFPSDVEKSLHEGFKQTEKEFSQITIDSKKYDNSGCSCTVIVVVDETVYVANTGDNRALLSISNSKKTIQLTQEHDCQNKEEYQRVVQNGGSFQQKNAIQAHNIQQNGNTQFYDNVVKVVQPGSLQVTRSFGNVQSKLDKQGKLQNVIISVPQIRKFNIFPNYDFMLIMNKGIYSKFSNNKELSDLIANSYRFEDVHNFAACQIQQLIVKTIEKQSMGNLSAIIICFTNVKKLIEQNQPNHTNKIINIIENPLINCKKNKK